FCRRSLGRQPLTPHHTAMLVQLNRSTVTFANNLRYLLNDCVKHVTRATVLARLHHNLTYRPFHNGINAHENQWFQSAKIRSEIDVQLSLWYKQAHNGDHL